MGLADVLVVLAIVSFITFIALTLLPRQREKSRQATCQDNLRQIGVGLQLYHQASSSYPGVVRVEGGPSGPSPLSTMLDSLALPSFTGLKDPSKRPVRSNPPGVGARVPGFVCPSDGRGPVALASSSISYRANAGVTVTGEGGPFSPGRTSSASSIDATKGLSFTAGFAERRIGTGLAGDADPANYALVEEIPLKSSTDTDSIPADRWRGDAGSDWGRSDWQSTLYQHDRPPTLATSLIAADRRSASIGVSSYHPNQIHLLMLDGSIRVVTPSMDRKIWRSLGEVTGPTPAP